MPLLIWVWAAVHGSFVIGLGLIALEAVRTGRRSLWGSLGVSSVAASLTAHGMALWGILIAFAESRGALDLIQEWAPPDLTDLSVAPYALIVVALLVAATRGSVGGRDLVVIAPFLLFGLTSYRALIPAALVLAPWAARAVELGAESRSTANGRLNAGIAVMLALAAVVLGSARAESTADPERFPIAAVGSMGPGPLFHGDAVGGYLIYAAWPDRPVYIDDRAELYGAERFREFVDARDGLPVWRDVFARYDISQALLPADETGLQQVLAAEGWTERYRDDGFLLLAP